MYLRELSDLVVKRFLLFTNNYLLSQITNYEFSYADRWFTNDTN